jgi:hypothetical protein
MKPNMPSPDSDASLSRVLAGWRVEPRRDPGFRAAVRSRLAVPGGLSWGAYLQRHALPVAAACGLAMLAGGWLGRAQARDQADADRDLLAEKYVRALDARTMTMP